jgi:hypothetical protein
MSPIPKGPKYDLLRQAQEAFDAGDMEKGYSLFHRHSITGLPDDHPVVNALAKDTLLTNDKVRIRAIVALNMKAMDTAGKIEKLVSESPDGHKDGMIGIIVEYIRERVEEQLPGTLAEILRHLEGYKPNE